MRSTGSDGLEPAPHCGDQAADHAAGGLALSDRSQRDVANITGARGGEQGQTDKRRECRAAVRVGEASDLLGAADADRAAEHALHIVGNILQLGAAAGEYDLTADWPGE